ncbi:hypothetical protein BDZ91DRAFT_802141 [Kalaharituber pfeilii]|nr:hypothetical protein BDZ91DRAFT_802141 [Kalaharituber pfeilii]
MSKFRILSHTETQQHTGGQWIRSHQHKELVLRLPFLTPTYLSTRMPYINGGNMHILQRFILGAWYQPDETEWQYNNYLVKVVACWKEGCYKTIPEILQAHRLLCKQVSARTGPGTAAIATQHADGKRTKYLHENHEEWVLLPLFHEVIIVVDKWEWWAHGVLLIAVPPTPVYGEESRLKSGPVDLSFLDGEEGTKKLGQGMYRVRVERAVEVVMELQEKEDRANGKFSVGKKGADAATRGMSVEEFMAEYFCVEEYPPKKNAAEQELE